jgi:hypothetical protein
MILQILISVIILAFIIAQRCSSWKYLQKGPSLKVLRVRIVSFCNFSSFVKAIRQRCSVSHVVCKNTTSLCRMILQILIFNNSFFQFLLRAKLAVYLFNKFWVFFRFSERHKTFQWLSFWKGSLFRLKNNSLIFSIIFFCKKSEFLANRGHIPSNTFLIKVFHFAVYPVQLPLNQCKQFILVHEIPPFVSILNIAPNFLYCT